MTAGGGFARHEVLGASMSSTACSRSSAAAARNGLVVVVAMAGALLLRLEVLARLWPASVIKRVVSSRAPPDSHECENHSGDSGCFSAMFSVGGATLRPDDGEGWA